MRTTLSLDRDVAEKAKAVTQKLGLPFKQMINDALRAGLDQMQRPKVPKPYRTRPHRMGLRQGFSLDNVQELLAQVDGEDAR